VSKLEADYIALKIGREIPRKPNRPIINETYCDPSRPCPFLVLGRADNLCTIYPHRPVLCRTYISLNVDNTNCQFESDKSELILLDRSRSWPGAMQAYAELVVRYGEAWGDIRDYFGATNSQG
jgi:Fe-S-cluster containining protein